MDKVTMPTCRSCPAYYIHDGRTALVEKGNLLHYGDRTCSGKKGKPRKFKGSDPTNKVPSWCSKRKSPCEVRVYGFKSATNWYLHDKLCKHFKTDINPNAWDYALVVELQTNLTPQEFWKRRGEPDAETIHVAVHTHWVVEIDDGIMPYFFYCVIKNHRRTYIPITGFQAEVARKNIREI